MKGRILGLLFAVFAAVAADAVFAQSKSTARAASTKRSSSATTAKVSTAKAPAPSQAPALPTNAQAAPATASPQAAPPAPQLPANGESSGEVPFVADCALHFNLCMDNICGDKFRSRANCSETIDSFETITFLDQKIRVGRDLFDFAKGSCMGAFTNCPLAERNKVENAYRIQIQSDVVSRAYAEAMAYTGEEAAREALMEYAGCMAPLCGGTGFPQCTTIAEIDRRAPKCEAILKKTARPLAVKRDFLDAIIEMMEDGCKSGGGSVDYETKRCSVKVEFGMPEIIKKGKEKTLTGRMIGPALASRTFMVGEMVECTQEYFSITYKENPNEKKAKFKTGFGIGKAVLGGAAIVAGVIVTVVTWGAVAPAAVQLIGAGISMSGDGAADIMEGSVMKDSGYRVGACFINGKYAASIGQFFRVGLMVQ